MATIFEAVAKQSQNNQTQQQSNTNQATQHFANNCVTNGFFPFDEFQKTNFNQTPTSPSTNIMLDKWLLPPVNRSSNFPNDIYNFLFNDCFRNESFNWFFLIYSQHYEWFIDCRKIQWNLLEAFMENKIYSHNKPKHKKKKSKIHWCLINHTNSYLRNNHRITLKQQNTKVIKTGTTNCITLIQVSITSIFWLLINISTSNINLNNPIRNILKINNIHCF